MHRLRTSVLDRTRIRVFVSVLFGLISSAAWSQAQTLPDLQCPSDEPQYKCKGESCLARITWPRDQEDHTVRLGWTNFRRRITEQTNLTLHVVGPNFLKYQVAFQFEQRPIESNAFLDRLWRNIVTPPVTGQRGQSVFDERMREWRTHLSASNDRINNILREYDALRLTENERASITQTRFAIVAMRDGADKARVTARDALKSEDEFLLFARTEALHYEVLERIEAFLEGARLTCAGLIRVVPRGEAGHLATITLIPHSLAAGIERQPLVVEYPVHSSFPVVFHLGYAHSVLNRLDVELVRTSSGQDLYTVTGDAEDTGAFGLFLSYDLRTVGLTWPILATVGTDLTKPGARFYFGGSLEFRNLVLTVGAGRADVTTVLGETFEAVAGSSQPRQLFASINREVGWRPFIAISLVPF